MENVGVGVRVGLNVGDNVFDTVNVCVTVGVRVNVDDPYGLIGPHEMHTASMYVPSPTVEQFVATSDVKWYRTYCVLIGSENATFCHPGPLLPPYGPHAVVHVLPFGEISTYITSGFVFPMFAQHVPQPQYVQFDTKYCINVGLLFIQ